MFLSLLPNLVGIQAEASALTNVILVTQSILFHIKVLVAVSFYASFGNPTLFSLIFLIQHTATHLVLSWAETPPPYC